MALRSTQILTEMSTGSISWGVKEGRYLGLTTLPLSCADCLRYPRSLNNILEPSGHVQACIGLYRDSFTFTFTAEYCLMFAFLMDQSQMPDICLVFAPTGLFISPSGDFRTRLRNNQDRHGRKEHINRLRISPSFFFCTRVLGILPGSTARG